MKRQTDNLSFLFSKNLAYAEQNNSMLWTKDRTLFYNHFTENLSAAVESLSSTIGFTIWSGAAKSEDLTVEISPSTSPPQSPART